MKRAVSIFTAALALTFVGNVSAEQPVSEPLKIRKKPQAKPRMDVVFAIDATGSMADEIDVIKKEVWSIANKLATGKPAPDIRFGLVFYWDPHVEVTPLTRDIDDIHEKLMAVSVGGGGDKPESVGIGLHRSLDLAWDKDPNVTRTIYLVGDAGDKSVAQYSLKSALQRAEAMNVKINTIGCSGMTAAERQQFTMIASNAGGAFEALTYYAVVEEPDGKKKSIVYYDGAAYEADGEISEKEWKKGGKDVIAKRKMKKASSRTKSRAAGAKKRNNLGSVVKADMVSEAEASGVSF